jgi:hypothetical protein
MALFLPYRALGYITDATPFAVQRRGKETFVTASVGKAWQVRIGPGASLSLCRDHMCMHDAPLPTLSLALLPPPHRSTMRPTCASPSWAPNCAAPSAPWPANAT